MDVPRAATDTEIPAKKPMKNGVPWEILVG
jgi:hypothetical protein